MVCQCCTFVRVSSYVALLSNKRYSVHVSWNIKWDITQFYCPSFDQFSWLMLHYLPFHSFISFVSFIQWHKNPCPYQNFHHSHSWKIQFLRNFLRQISCFQGCDIEACLYKLQDNCLQSCFALNTCVQLIDLILLKQDTLSSVVWGHLSVRFKIKMNCF